MARKKPKVGEIAWRDLTVKNAKSVRDFYADVVGWEVEEVPMGKYADYGMKMKNGEMVAGICHAKNINKNMPPQWMIYIIVDDLDTAIAKVKKRRGQVLDGPRPLSGGRFAVIKDPAGAVCALFQS